MDRLSSFPITLKLPLLWLPDMNIKLSYGQCLGFNHPPRLEEFERTRRNVSTISAYKTLTKSCRNISLLPWAWPSFGGLTQTMCPACCPQGAPGWCWTVSPISTATHTHTYIQSCVNTIKIDTHTQLKFTVDQIDLPYSNFCCFEAQNFHTFHKLGSTCEKRK